jgi:hypothetical protein
MKMNIKLTIVALFAVTRGHAQVVPAATGPGGPLVSGNVGYSLYYSQTATLYGANQANEGSQVSSIAAATLDYARPSSRLPLNLNYGGGYVWSIEGPSLGTGVFQHFVVSQGIVQRRWNVLASDGVSYTPEAPTTGFSGVAGTGEPIGGSGTNASSSESILTLNTRTLSNLASASLGFALNYATTLSASGGLQLLRFPDGNGLNSDGQDASAGITRRINALNSISGQYLYSRFSYGASPYSSGVSGSFDTSSISFEYQRTWNRQIKTDVAVGPQWTTGSVNALVPATKGLMANAAVDYAFRKESAGVSYNRGIEGGLGFLPGGTVNSVDGHFSRTFAGSLTIGATGSYFRTVPLGNLGGATDARFGGVQISQRLGRHLNAFASYTAIDQSSGLSGSTPQGNVLNQLYQVIGFGITCTPRETRFRQ